MNYDEKLRVARDNIARRDSLKEALQKLYLHQKELKIQADRLAEARQSEEKDVKRLEGFSLNSVFSTISGTKEEKLEKERREADAAAFRHEEALISLGKIEDTIRDAEEELSSLRGCERTYRLLLDKKREAIKASASPEAESILRLESELSILKAAGKRIGEAIDAGAKALDAVHFALEFHGEAAGRSLSPTTSHILRTIEERRLVDDAQSTIAPMQEAAAHFGALLKELNIPAAVSAPDIDLPFSPAVPYLFTRLSALGSMDEIEALKHQIHAAKEILGRMMEENASECTRIRAKIDDATLKAALAQSDD